MSAGLGSSRVDVAPKAPRLETLVTEFAIELTVADSKQLEERLAGVLERLGDRIEADGVALLSLPAAAGAVPSSASVRRAWSRSRELGAFSDATLPLLPLTLGKLQQGESVGVESGGSAAESQASERAVYEQLGISALCGLPLRVGTELLGALVLSWRGERKAWTPQLSHGLRGIAAVISSALARLRNEQESSGTHGVPVVATLAEVDRAHILEVLRASNWVVAGPRGAAARLGMKRSTLNFRMQKLGIARERR